MRNGMQKLYGTYPRIGSPRRLSDVLSSTFWQFQRRRVLFRGIAAGATFRKDRFWHVNSIQCLSRFLKVWCAPSQVVSLRLTAAASRKNDLRCQSCACGSCTRFDSSKLMVRRRAADLSQSQIQDLRGHQRLRLYGTNTTAAKRSC